MLPTPPQADAAGAVGGNFGGAVGGAVGGAKEEFGEPTEFISWAAKGAADLILPKIGENSDNDEETDDDASSSVSSSSSSSSL